MTSVVAARDMLAAVLVGVAVLLSELGARPFDGLSARARLAVFKIGWTYRWRLDFFIAPFTFAERSEALSGCLLCFSLRETV